VAAQSRIGVNDLFLIDVLSNQGKFVSGENTVLVYCSVCRNKFIVNATNSLNLNRNVFCPNCGGDAYTYNGGGKKKMVIEV